jgi:hypothetical protein
MWTTAKPRIVSTAHRINAHFSLSKSALLCLLRAFDHVALLHQHRFVIFDVANHPPGRSRYKGAFLRAGGTPSEYGAGIELAWLTRHESGTYVQFTQAGADLFAWWNIAANNTACSRASTPYGSGR